MARSSYELLPTVPESAVAKNSSRCATKDIVAVVSAHADASAATRKFRMRWDP